MKYNSRKYYIYGLTMLIFIVATPLFMQAGETMDNCPQTAKKLRDAAKVELAVGSDTALIKYFLVQHQIKYSWDQFVGRYQGITRAVKDRPGIDCAVVTYIYIDMEGPYIKSEFIATYTGL